MKYYGLKVGNYFFLEKYTVFTFRMPPLKSKSVRIVLRCLELLLMTSINIFLILVSLYLDRVHVKWIWKNHEHGKIFAFKNNRCCVLYQLVIYQVSVFIQILRVFSNDHLENSCTIRKFFSILFALVFNLHFIIFLFTLSVYL